MEINNEIPTIEYLDEESTKEMLKDFKCENIGWVLVGNKKYFLPVKYAKQCSIYYNFEVRPDDTWSVTFPRSGTTWTQELIWLLSNDLDYVTARSTNIEQRFPFLESSITINEKISQLILEENQANAEVKSTLSDVELSYEIIRSMLSPRFIKTHFPLSLVPNILQSGCKVVYVARNPKDVAVSWYHLNKSMNLLDYQGDFEKFWDYFQNDRTSWSSYWEHLKEAWAQRHNPNFLFLFYEEMTQDLLAVAKKVAEFLGKSYTDEEFNKLVDHLQFSNIKDNKAVNAIKYKFFFKQPNSFIRQGKSQAWHSIFTPELNNKANAWIEKNLRNTDLKFPYTDIYS